MSYADIPRTEGMTDEERDRAWDQYYERKRTEDAQILRPIREEVGYPVDPYDPDLWYGTDNEVTERYIQALETAVTANARVASILRASR